MIVRVLSLLRTLAPAKYLVVVVGAVMVGLAGWLYIAYERIENLQGKLDRAHEQAGQYELALQDKELDMLRLRETIDRQNTAIRELAARREEAMKLATERAELIASMKTPPAGDGAKAMQAWWDENVANR